MHIFHSFFHTPVENTLEFGGGPGGDLQIQREFSHAEARLGDITTGLGTSRYLTSSVPSRMSSRARPVPSGSSTRMMFQTFPWCSAEIPRWQYPTENL